MKIRFIIKKGKFKLEIFIKKAQIALRGTNGLKKTGFSLKNILVDKFNLLYIVSNILEHGRTREEDLYLRVH